MRRRAKGIQVPGLKIARRPGHMWCVSHEASALIVACKFKTKWQAEDFCEAIADLTQWESDDIEVVTDAPRLGSRCGAIAAAIKKGVE